MTTTKTSIINGLTNNNKVIKNLIELLDKWKNIDYKLTDKEWVTIKSYKATYELFRNDKNEMLEYIKNNNTQINKLKLIA
tara:strand:- start:1368 stop:1607 length:240 start_codon:yes stop_codon:yes gene_type:complete